MISGVLACVHAPPCGGCPYLGLDYPAQLDAKRQRLALACRRYHELASTPVAPTLGADPILGYRRRAKWVVDGERVGLYAPATHAVVDLCDCRVVDPRLSDVAGAIRRSLPWSPLRGLDLVRIESGVLVTWVVEQPSGHGRRAALIDDAKARARELVAACPDVRGVSLGLRRRDAVQLLGHELVHLWGDAEIVGRVASSPAWHYVAPGSFAQVHAGQERQLHAAIRAALREIPPSSERPRVLELFAGSGALALALAAEGASVTAVEAFLPSVERGRRAAAEQRLEPSFVSADATRALQELSAARARFDVILVNPPRRGLEPALRALLPSLEPKLIVYVSCEPATLARDLAVLARHGWLAREIGPLDMIPLTSQVEALVLLRPGEPPLPRVIQADPELLAVEQSPHEPLLPGRGRVPCLLERVRRLPGASGALVLQGLDLQTSGVALFARQPEAARRLTEPAAKASREFIGLTKGVVRSKGRIGVPVRARRSGREGSACYQRQRVVGGHSLVTVTLEPACRPDLRRAFAAIGHPLLGDPRYGDPASNRHFWFRHGLDRTFLHCVELRLELDGKSLELRSPLAADLESVLGRLELVEEE